MTRNIPPCRPWRVRYWQDDKIILEVRVNAVNADFAKYNASRIVATKVREYTRIDGSKGNQYATLHVHLEGEASEYWMIKIDRDDCPDHFPKVHTGSKRYIMKRWGK